ncbi:MAG: alpha/beta fold hydrolase [Oleispira sp.]|nr:alpha/beta fold hydrolase [Oleispira sp.]
MRYQSLFHHEHNHSLHLMHISQPGQGGIPILMIHGMVEDGRIFYHKSGKGLGSYMAKQGYAVYVADLRGMGLSTPKINAASTHGQTETIQQDIPALIRFVLDHSGHKQLHLMAHSWGGVYINSALLHQADLIPQVISSTFFGSKRTVRARTFERYLKINLIWNHLSLAASKRKGYLPAISYKLGSENESHKTHKQCVDWVRNDAWGDSDDGFDYGAAAQTTILPPTHHIAAIRDISMGHRFDVKAFMKESGPHKAEYTLLAKKHGNNLDYDHINMLTAPECVSDHFPTVFDWIKKQEN